MSGGGGGELPFGFLIIVRFLTEVGAFFSAFSVGWEVKSWCRVVSTTRRLLWQNIENM